MNDMHHYSDESVTDGIFDAVPYFAWRSYSSDEAGIAVWNADGKMSADEMDFDPFDDDPMILPTPAEKM